MANDGAPTDNGEPPSVAAGIGARAPAEDEKCNMLMQAHNRISTLLRQAQNTGIQGSSTAPAPSVPEIVILGEQSSGKSSVLNLVADAKCPVLMTDPDTGTRMPTKLQLLQEATEEPWLLMYCEGDDKGDRYTGVQLSQAALNAAFKAKQDEVAGTGFSDRPMVIEYHGPVRQPLTLIDLMGFAESKFINGEPQGPWIRKVAQQFVDVPSNRVPPVVVCVMSAETHIENDATVNFIRKLQREGKFSPRELVIVHNKLDRAEHGPEGLARKIKHIHSPDGIEGVHITHFGIKALFSPDGEPQPLTAEELTYWATGIAGCRMRPCEQCYLHASGAAVAFGADLLGAHLKKVLSEKFRETLRGRAGLEKQLSDAIENEKYIVASIPAPLRADKSTIRTILERVYTQFNIAFTSAGLVGGSAVLGEMEKEKATEIVEHAKDQACRLIEDHTRKLLEADQRKSLLDHYREQRLNRVDRADNIFVVNQLMKHMDLGHPDRAGLVDELHGVLAKCMRDLTEKLVYPALCKFSMGTGSDGRQTLYDISHAGPYSNLFKELNDWIVESFHGLTDDQARTQDSASAWRKIRPPFDQHGFIVPSIPFDAHQHLHSALKSTSFAFTASELRKVPEAKMRDAMQVLRQDTDKLLKLQGTPCFNQVVSPESLQLLEELIAICKTTTKYPTYYSPHIDQIRTPEGRGGAMDNLSGATEQAQVSLTEWVRAATGKIVTYNGQQPVAMITATPAPPPPPELPTECSGVYEYINSGFSFSKTGAKRFMRIDNAGMLKSWPNRDYCEAQHVPCNETDLTLLRPNNYKGSEGRNFRLELKPDPQAKGQLQQIYSFPSAYERNEWFKVFESFLLPTPDEIIRYAREKAEAHVSHEHGLPNYTDIKDELSKTFGPKVLEQPHVEQEIQQLLAELHTERSPLSGAAPADKMLENLRDDLRRKEAAAKAVEEKLYHEYREFQQRRGDDTPLHRGDGSDDGVVDIAWRMKKEYSNGAEFLCGELTKHIRKVFEYVTENMMADNAEYRERFTTKFDSKDETEVRLMFDCRADLEQQHRDDAQAREQLYLQAQAECRTAMGMLPGAAGGGR